MIGRIINLPKIVDPRGNLTVAEQMRTFRSKLPVSTGLTTFQAESGVAVMLIAHVKRLSLL